jgi:hypothetical protein
MAFDFDATSRPPPVNPKIVRIHERLDEIMKRAAELDILGGQRRLVSATARLRKSIVPPDPRPM